MTKQNRIFQRNYHSPLSKILDQCQRIVLPPGQLCCDILWAMDDVATWNAKNGKFRLVWKVVPFAVQCCGTNAWRHPFPHVCLGIDWGQLKRCRMLHALRSRVDHPVEDFWLVDRSCRPLQRTALSWLVGTPQKLNQDKVKIYRVWVGLLYIKTPKKSS